ncbi:hypothetical protein, partial [Paenibacillus xylanexedens]|uniref:hypothetical protein n=1 Tax=Paenibacillus xylanexedens TaxID=528191 RepID=UPI00119E0221
MRVMDIEEGWNDGDGGSFPWWIGREEWKNLGFGKSKIEMIDGQGGGVWFEKVMEFKYRDV